MSESEVKLPVHGGMTVRTYSVLHRAVEEGAAYGWRRAHKYTNTPDEDTIKDQIVAGVLHEISDYFDFSDDR